LGVTIRASVLGWIGCQRGTNDDRRAADGCIEVDFQVGLCIRTRRDTHQVRVPEQAYGSPIDGSYEVSEKLSTAIDLQRICCGVSFSIKAIAPPQCGQSHEH
jgi:hypothetical protein